MNDVRAVAARREHRAIDDAKAKANEHRAERNRLIRQLRDEGWTHAALAKAIGCSVELVAHIDRATRE